MTEPIPRHQLRSVSQSPAEEVADEVETLLVDTVGQVRQLPTKADVTRVRRKSDRDRNIAIAIAVALSVAAVLFSYVNSLKIASTAAATEINSSAYESLSRARDDLRASGVPENKLPPAPPTIISAPDQVDVGALIDATEATVLARIRSDPEFRGQAGIQGDPGIPGQPGEQGIQGLTGDTGLPGLNGLDGEDGRPPVSFTIPNTAQDPNNPDDDIFFCTRSNEDDEAPTYQCN